MGYGTQQHLDALQRLGPSPVHRQSFAPVPRQLAVGDRLLNPGTLEVHRVTAVDDDGVTFTAGDGTATARWDDVVAACWLVVE